jgi:hypothetical protein
MTNLACDVAKCSMTRRGIFCHIIYYFRMIDEYIGNIPIRGMEYFATSYIISA